MKLDAPRAALLIFLTASLLYHAARIFLSISTLANPAAYPPWPFRLESFSRVVAEPRAEARDAGLIPGDEITRIGGHALRGFGDVSSAIRVGAAAGRVDVEIERAGVSQTLVLPLSVPPRRLASLGEIASVAVLDVLLPLFLLGVGFVVVWFKPHDRAAWILLLMMQAFSNFGRGELPFDRLGPVLGTFCAMWMSFFASSWATSMAAFALAFPEPLPLDRRFPWIKWILFIPLLAASVMSAGVSFGIADIDTGGAFVALTRAFGRRVLVLTYLSVSVFFWILGLKVGTTTHPDSLRRLKILLAGAFIGMTPAGVIATLALVSGKGFGNQTSQLVQFIAVLMMLIFPLTLAYVVIVHKAMGIGSVLRQGLQYALAQRAVRVVQVVVGIVVVWGLLDIMSDPDSRRVDRLGWMARAVIFMIVFQKGADRFRQWIDRRFFREAVDTERILSDLGDRVRLIADRRELLETVSRTVSEALHVPKIAAFVRGDSAFVPAFASGYADESVRPEFALGTALTRSVTTLQKPQTVYLDDKRSWTVRENIAEADTSKLRDLQSEVLIPLRTKGALEGFLSLGPKSSDAAYSPSDLQLLQSVAHQTAFALDNSRLVEQVASEVAKRERLTREIEIAREVQFTLLPQTPPTIARLDLAGFCRPAAGVGGDYYDFIPLEGERSIGLAIGDIAGKGIPAALLMAGLQAALRGQALVGSRDLAKLMTNINKLIFESSPSNRYATFFYGEYRDGRFAYVNAGHNAPILLRKDGRVERLEAGGPVIGLMDFAPFSEGSVDIAPGDLLLGYTDGVSECMNPQDEEWSEDEVIKLLQQDHALTSAEIVTRVMSAADAFASGAKQHDDMTLIVMKAL